MGIKPWKRWQIDAFLRPRFAHVSYARSARVALRRQARRGGDLIVWASREPCELAGAAAAQGARLLRIEDGFIRSVGLGSNHIGGASLVIDESGIYYDPRTASDLERLLQMGHFETSLITRAVDLRRKLVNSGLSKYNVGSDEFTVGGSGRTRLLVPGQVENDASVLLGAPEVGSNLELLARVRQACPKAWIVYKPHPDAEAGTRPGAVTLEAVLAYADQIALGVAPDALLRQVDAVHTMTSLLGFEALLRGVPVTVWGRPFYAGWGLTQDRFTLLRRTRKLTLDELVAGTLLCYASYVHPLTLKPCQAEDVVDYLGALKAASPSSQRNPLLRVLRLCRGLIRSVRSAVRA